jgi:hypothetical protein
MQFADIKSLTVALGEHPAPKEYDREKQTGYIAAWLDWLRGELNGNDVDFMEAWLHPNEGVDRAEFLIMHRSRAKLGAEIKMVFNVNAAEMRVLIYRIQSSGEREKYRDTGGKPIDPSKWDDSQKEEMDVIINDLAELISG